MPTGIQKGPTRTSTRTSSGVQGEFRGIQGDSKGTPRGCSEDFKATPRGCSEDFKVIPRECSEDFEASPRGVRGSSKEVESSSKVVEKWVISDCKVSKTHFLGKVFL